MSQETIDRATTDRSTIYAPEGLGKTRRLTPEGYLLCEGVAIARTGEQVYSKSELALDPGSDGLIIVMREAEHVFHPDAVASFEGKPVTVEHPNEFVNPSNYKELEVGTAHNVRRGEGIEDDVLLADLLIKDPEAILMVNKYKPEISCGYKSEYKQLVPGRATQTQIVGNHVALVDRGRAGPRCAIKDADGVTPFINLENFLMAKKATPNIVQRVFRLMKAVENKDAAAVAEELGTQDDADDPDDTMDSRLKKIEDWMKDSVTKDAEAKAKAEKEVNDKIAKDAADKVAKDAADKAAQDALLTAEAAPSAPDLGVLRTGDSLKDILARAEILSPGIQVPTQDALAVGDAAPMLMLAAVKAAYTKAEGKECVDAFLIGNKIEVLTKDNVLGVFTGAAELMRARNKHAARVSNITATTNFGKAITPESFAENNRKFWAERGG